MGFWDKLKAELVDIVEWIDDPGNTLVWRFPRYDNQIKQGAKLIVRPGQLAILVYRGKLADVFEPGTHTLETGNLPILSTLAGWKHGFNSPIKCEVYFIRTTQLTDLKWGTPNPIMLRDPEFGPIRLRAFGTYTLRTTDPRALLTELVATDSHFEVQEVNEFLRALIVETFAEVLGQSEVAALDLASNYRAMSGRLRAAVCERIDDEYGLDMPMLMIVNISLPEEVEQALDTRSTMGVLGDMGRYQQYQMGRAMTMAAENPGSGGASEGMGLGMGFAMANQMMQGMGNAAAPGGAPSGMSGMAPPPPPAAAWHIAVNGQTRGPVSPADIAALIAAGQLGADTLVWTAGMSGWTAAGQVPAFAQHFGAAPPPPPPVG